MTTRTAEPGRYFYDAAGFVSLQCVVNAARLDADVSLYMGGDYGCSRAHVIAANDNGAGVIPNWERQADRALRGYADGRACVDSAMTTADQWQFDYTKVPTIFSGVDFGPTSAQYAAMDDWHRGLVDRGDELGMLVGAYGQTAYVDHLRRQGWWGDRPIWVWGGSGTFDGMHVKQHIRAVSDKAVGTIGCTVDENVVWRPLVVWAGEGLDPEEVDVTPDEMRTVVHETVTGILRADEFRLNAALVEALIRIEANFPSVVHDEVTYILRADEFKLNAALVEALTRIEAALASVDSGVAPHNHNVTGTAT